MEPRLTLDSLSRDCRDPCFTRSEVKEGQSGLYSLDLEVLPLPVLGFSWVLAQERRHSLEMETVWGCSFSMRPMGLTSGPSSQYCLVMPVARFSRLTPSPSFS